MEKLKKQIIKNFIIYALGLSVAESILDSLFDDCLFQLVEDNTVQMKLLLAVYLILSIVFFIIAAVCFYKAVSRKIEEETRRQINEKNMLIANMAHDLKTPITSILGFSRALKDKKVQTDEQEEISGIIYEKAKRTDELINIMFRYSKLETEDYKLTLEKQNICALIRNVVADNYSEFEQREIEVQIDIPEKAYICSIDNIEFVRAFHNIIVNAYKHNPEGSRVLVAVQKKNEKVVIIVADNGDVFTEKMLKTIFEPFVCGSESRNSRDGSGLGLAISKKIIEKHNGRLYVKEDILNYSKGFVIELEICD